MKIKSLTLLRVSLLLPTMLSFGLAGSAHAGFQYTPRDLVFVLRKNGGSSKVPVKAAPAANFYNLPAGQSITVSNITITQLTTAFGVLDDLSWSAAADVRTNGDAAYPIQTLWVVSPRTDLNTQTTPWNRGSQFSQGPTGAKIDGIAIGGVSYGAQQPTGADNTSTGVIVPSGSEYSYGYFMGSGNYASTFQGSVEVTTPSEFGASGQPVRADFYQLKPGTGPATYLGFFDFNTNGVMTYTAGPPRVPLPPPTITSVTRIGATAPVNFSTISGAHYSLRVTNSSGLSAPATTWPVSGSAIVGDGSTKSLSDTTTDPARFYRISVTP